MPGSEYNTRSTVTARAVNINSAGQEGGRGPGGVGAEIRLDVDTVLVSDPAAASNPLAAPYGFDQGASIELFEQIAIAGLGGYFDALVEPITL
jgi:hypothetical protein